MKKTLLILMGILCSLFSVAQKPDNKPKLIVGIVVEQMRYDFIAKYWNKYGNNGFKKIINSGTLCKNAHYKYLNVNSAAGYASVSCGSYPAQHGIINKSWYNRISNQKKYCVDDNHYKQIGTDFGSGKSPTLLSSITWTDQLRISSYKMSKVFSVGIKDYSSILSGGKLANGAYWFDDNSGKWVSSSFYYDNLKDWVKKFNDKKFMDIYLKQTWKTTYPIDKYIESLSDATAYEKGFNGKNTFPYNLDSINSSYIDYSLIKYTPLSNTFTKDFAINLMMNEYLGRDSYTDVLLINFSATSFIGEIFGLQSVEMEDAYIKLDKDIAHFIAAVEDYAGKENVLFYLTSDRGSCDNQQWLEDINIKTGIFNPTRTTVVISSYLRAVYGKKNWIEGFYNNEFYLNNFEIDKNSHSVDEFQKKTAQVLVNSSGVTTVIPTSDLIKGTFSSGIMQKAQNSYFQERSGDLMFVLDYGWKYKNNKDNLCGCNSSYNENTHVPLIFYGANISKKNIYREISMNDLAVTLCFLMDIALPNKSTGKPIIELLD